MAALIADRIKETSTTTGTGSYTLAGAVSGFLAFSSRFSTGNVIRYAVVNQDVPTEWEVGRGTYTSPSTLARTTIEASSNSDAAVSFSAGTKIIFVNASAASITTNVNITGGSIDGTPIGATTASTGAFTTASFTKASSGDVITWTHSGATATAYLYINTATIALSRGAITTDNSLVMAPTYSRLYGPSQTAYISITANSADVLGTISASSGNTTDTIAARSGNATQYAAVSVGRTAADTYLGVAGGTGQFLAGSNQGDTILTAVGAQRVLIGANSTLIAILASGSLSVTGSGSFTTNGAFGAAGNATTFVSINAAASTAQGAYLSILSAGTTKSQIGAYAAITGAGTDQSLLLNSVADNVNVKAVTFAANCTGLTVSGTWSKIASCFESTSGNGKGLGIGYETGAQQCVLWSGSSSPASFFTFRCYTGSAWADAIRINSSGILSSSGAVSAPTSVQTGMFTVGGAAGLYKFYAYVASLGWMVCGDLSYDGTNSVILIQHSSNAGLSVTLTTGTLNALQSNASTQTVAWSYLKIA